VVKNKTHPSIMATAKTLDLVAELASVRRELAATRARATFKVKKLQQQLARQRQASGSEPESDRSGASSFVEVHAGSDGSLSGSDPADGSVAGVETSLRLREERLDRREASLAAREAAHRQARASHVGEAQPNPDARAQAALLESVACIRYHLRRDMLGREDARSIPGGDGRFCAEEAVA
jgi:hypothetical protein